jgi:hydroxymethylglutaryl-CoA lyase
MQGWKRLIPASEKATYINSLLDVGFHTIDFGSFVSPRLMPQMADTAEVLAMLKPSASKLLAIIANRRGAEDACRFERISYLGFPFSVSETFQQRNTNSSREESLLRLGEILQLCRDHGKELVVYMSMGFGNPYGDAYDQSILRSWTDKVRQLGVNIISLADTVGMATPGQVRQTLEELIPVFPDITLGVHLHSTPAGLKDKMLAAWDAGCRRIDGAIGGIGGCPMADDELVGNMDTAAIIGCLEEKGIGTGLDMTAFNKARAMAAEIFI